MKLTRMNWVAFVALCLFSFGCATNKLVTVSERPIPYDPEARIALFALLTGEAVQDEVRANQVTNWILKGLVKKGYSVEPFAGQDIDAVMRRIDYRPDVTSVDELGEAIMAELGLRGCKLYIFGQILQYGKYMSYVPPRALPMPTYGTTYGTANLYGSGGYAQGSWSSRSYGTQWVNIPGYWAAVPCVNIRVGLYDVEDRKLFWYAAGASYGSRKTEEGHGKALAREFVKKFPLKSK